MKKLGIYIHIPFCLSKCKYCGFYSYEAASQAEHSEYVKKLIEDIREYGLEYGDEYSVDTVFIGGGTPSVIEPSLIGKLLREIERNFALEKDREITIEANPGTISREKLTEYRKYGINRLSIGLQAFNDEILKSLGRVHSVSDFEEAFILARRIGFDNINTDLMFSVPGQNIDMWLDTLDKTIALLPEHISFYSLQLEEGTPFFQMFMAGEIEQTSDDADREMYHQALCRLKEAGYDHYEISNCARPGFKCRHNLKYWSMDDYLGIGSGASSYMNGIRFAESPLMEYHKNDFHDEVSEFVFTGLRKTCGIDLTDFKKRYGREFWDVFSYEKRQLSEFFQKGQLICERGTLRLSEHGIDVSNRIMAIFV